MDDKVQMLSLLFELLRQLDRRFGALGAEHVIEGERTHLLDRRFHHLLVAESEPRAPQAGHPFDVGPASRVVDVDTGAPLQHHCADGPQPMDRRVGMQQRLDVARLQVRKRGKTVHAG